MARAQQEKHGIPSSSYTPIREVEESDDFEEAVSGSGGCGCFRVCCFGFGFGRKNQESNNLLQNRDLLEFNDSWAVKKLKELKEFSEVVAGPKWKNLVRKVGKCFKPKKSRTQAMYSPQSYALNFDQGEEEESDGFLFANFSSRFSAPLNQQKTVS